MQKSRIPPRVSLSANKDRKVDVSKRRPPSTNGRLLVDATCAPADVKLLSKVGEVRW